MLIRRDMDEREFVLLLVSQDLSVAAAIRTSPVRSLTHIRSTSLEIHLSGN